MTTQCSKTQNKEQLHMIDLRKLWYVINLEMSNKKSQDTYKNSIMVGIYVLQDSK